MRTWHEARKNVIRDIVVKQKTTISYTEVLLRQKSYLYSRLRLTPLKVETCGIL